MQSLIIIMKELSQLTFQEPNYHARVDLSQSCPCAICRCRNAQPGQQTQHNQSKQLQQIKEQQSLRFVLETLVQLPIKETIKINIPDIFFFKRSKVVACFGNNEKGELCKSCKYMGLKGIESTIVSKTAKKIPEDPDLIDRDPVYTCVYEKFERRKKQRNDIALIKFMDGTFKIVNQFAFLLEIQKCNFKIDYIQTYFKDHPVYINFEYTESQNDPLFMNALHYVGTLKGEIVKWDKQYISKEKQLLFQLSLEDVANNHMELVRYLSYKIINLLNLTKILIQSCRFEWVVERQSNKILLLDLQKIKFVRDLDQHLDLEKFEEIRQNKLGEQIKNLSQDQPMTHYEFNHRIQDFNSTLIHHYQGQKAVILPTEQQKLQEYRSDQVFKYLHPETKMNLTEILSNESVFRTTAGSMFKVKSMRRISRTSGNTRQTRATTTQIQKRSRWHTEGIHSLNKQIQNRPLGQNLKYAKLKRTQSVKPVNQTKKTTRLEKSLKRFQYRVNR